MRRDCATSLYNRIEIDLSAVDDARENAGRVQADFAAARTVYYSAIKELVDAHGATAIGNAVGISRARIFS